MDSLDKMRDIICNILTEYAQIPYSYGEIDRKTVFDRASDRYLLVIVGWEGIKRVHGCLIHLEIIAGKIWIQRDGTEDGIANDLLQYGIRKDQIVLGFCDPEMRQYTEFAVG
ncbi:MULTISPECIES: XisI protein [Planktothricoides]|uniref:XisI protein n=2 Tax=Planktothricoides raciborskii TaxID=132608 RepID=A0AAU8JF68_9CYAN|nr:MULTISPECIES: XisI protein [Planktothricoides]KOR34931.1 FdxN element excision controlling factor protein [Planktothricoides sp. SR001]MBD2544316.1 XisI protein [Planktothricoides raciborskii FACHB-1370]MBD2582163.1 XisI protein [Planktothricoides raciborskii FACHB-1261]